MRLNFSVLPFYDSLEEQNDKKSYAYGDVYPLYMPKGVILPFQIFNINIGVYSASHRWWLINANTTQATDITSAMDNYISVVAISTTKENIIFFNENTLILPSISIGRYYLRLDLNYGSLYSDIITFVDNNDNYIFLEWNNIKNLDCEVGTIVYELQDEAFFKNRLYLATELGKPDYALTEEGEERNGYFFPIKQISEKTYKFNFLSCEYLLDVLRLIHLADYIKVIDIHGKSYSANEFKIEYEWQEQGNLAAVTATFQTEAVIKKIAATIDIVEPDYINLDMFHAVVPANTTKSVIFDYPYNVNIDNLNFAGILDDNGHIEAWKDVNENYYIINPVNIDMYFPTCSELFHNYRAITSIKWSQACNTKNVTSMYRMFRYCNNLINLDIESLITDNVITMQQMFDYCYIITNINLSNFNTEHVTTMNYMFRNCRNLVTLDLSNFNTENVTDMAFMISECRDLTDINIANFNTKNVTTMIRMFENCARLTTIISRTFELDNIISSERMFAGSSRLVGGNGTTYNSANITAAYARVDGENNLPGYFTAPS